MIILDGQKPDSPCIATIGFFDGVHPGHRYLIRQVQQEARRKGMKSLIVSFSNHPRQVVHPEFIPRQLTTLPEKIDLLRSTGADYLLLLPFTPALSQLTAKQFMQQILQEQCHADTLFIGYDHRFGHNRCEGFSDYARYGRELGLHIRRAEVLPPEAEEPLSSSLIRRTLQAGDAAHAAHLLGRPYEVAGTVVRGMQLGRTLGFPTANIDYPIEKLIPADGVYAAAVSPAPDLPDPLHNQEGKTSQTLPPPFHEERLGVLNIGICPTMRSGEPVRTLEVHLPGYEGNLYGTRLRVRFLQRMREQQRFPSPEQLRAQLRIDVRTAQEMYPDL